MFCIKGKGLLRAHPKITSIVPGKQRAVSASGGAPFKGVYGCVKGG